MTFVDSSAESETHRGHVFAETARGRARLHRLARSHVFVSGGGGCVIGIGLGVRIVTDHGQPNARLWRTTRVIVLFFLVVERGSQARSSYEAAILTNHSENFDHQNALLLAIFSLCRATHEKTRSHSAYAFDTHCFDLPYLCLFWILLLHSSDAAARHQFAAKKRATVAALLDAMPWLAPYQHSGSESGAHTHESH
jgi:hypothetical protein